MNTAATQSKVGGESLRYDVRRVRPSDSAELADFYAGLSAASRRARFLGTASTVSEDLSRTFCTPDHLHAEGFVARLGRPGGGEGDLIGHLCLEPAGRRRLEVAVAVADEQQGRGIGRALMSAAITWAGEHAAEAIVASAFSDNSRVLRLLGEAPSGVRVLPADGGVVDVVIPLEAALSPDLSLVAPLPLRRRLRGRPVRPRHPSAWRRRRRPARGAAD